MKDISRNLTMLCDFYELTMAGGYFRSGIGDRIAYFDLFYRDNPDGGGYAVVAGLEQIVDYIRNLHFTEEDIAFLRGKGCFDEPFLDYLRSFRFTGDMWAVPEGTFVFPGEPLITVRAPAIQAQFIETYLLMIVNHESLIATKAARITRAAKGRAVSEFGSRRAQGADAAILGARAAFIGGCSSTAGWGWRQLDVEIPLTSAAPADTPVLTDTYDGVQVQLKGTQATITVSPAPKTATWNTELNLRLEQARTYPILGSYNEYVDVCIGQQTDSVFHPVVYLLTKDGVVEYVDVLRCLLFGNAMICQDPIYIANNGVSLERSGNSKVNLRRKDGSVLELAELSSEWSVQGIPYSITGSFNCTNGNWLELSGDGSVQLGVQNNSRIDQGDAAYLGVVPEGMVLAIFTDTGLDFVAAFKMDLYDNLTLTMIDGQNPFAEGETQLQMTRSYD